MVRFRDQRRWLSWHRRVIAAGLVAVAVGLALYAVRPGPPPSVAVVVAARDLPGGQRLTSADLAERDLPEVVVPDGALTDRRAAAGRLPAGPIRAGEPLTDVRLVGQSLLATYHPGDDDGSSPVIAPVRPTDPGLLSVITAGDRVDVLAAAPGAPASVVARDVPILAIIEPGAGMGATGNGLLGSNATAFVLVAVSPRTAADLATAAVDAHLSLVLHGT